MSQKVVIGPQGGAGSPQHLFLTTRADFALFVGQPGSGKSAALTLDLLRGVQLPLFRAAAFRRQQKQLKQGGGLWDLATRWFPHAGGNLVEGNELRARFPSGASIGYHHLNHEKDKESFDGASFDALSFDELPHFTQTQFWYMAGSRNRGVSGYLPTVRATAMAAPDTWVHELVKPWLDKEGRFANWAMSGVLRWFVRNPFDDKINFFESRADAEAFLALLRLESPADDLIHDVTPKSMTVVHARTKDNQILLNSAKDYRSGLALMTKYERDRLSGDWHARPPSAGMFDRSFFKVLEEPPSEDQIIFSVRGWDRAASVVSDANTDPDYTRGVRLDLLRTGQLVISNVVSLRDRPGQVDQLMKMTAALDGPKCTQAMWINPGDSGLFEQEKLELMLREVRGCGPLAFEREIKNKESYARPLAAFFDPEVRGVALGAIVRASWNGECLAEAEMFPLKKHPVTGDDLHDDFVDAMSRAYIEIVNRKTGKLGKLLDWARASA